MNSKFRAFFLCTMFSIAPFAIADAEQEQSACFFLDRECIAKERIYKKRAAQERTNAEMLKKAQQASIGHEAERQAKREEEQRQSDLKYQQYLAERERKMAEMKKEREDDERTEIQAKKRRDVETADLKKRCGIDYKTPAIGMRIERVQECVAPVKLISQINRSDGVVSTYRAGQITVHVMSGRVMAWDRL